MRATECVLQEAEFAINIFTMTLQRQKVADFSVEIHHDNQAILTPRPSLETDILGFVKPFTTDVSNYFRSQCVTYYITISFVKKIISIDKNNMKNYSD